MNAPTNNHPRKTKRKPTLVAAGLCVAAGFFAINLYPQYHGLKFIPPNGLLALTSAIVVLMSLAVRKTLASDDEVATADLNRLERMTRIWNVMAVVLAASLLRYPIGGLINGEPTGLRHVVAMAVGCGVAIAAVLQLIRGHITNQL